VTEIAGHAWGQFGGRSNGASNLRHRCTHAGPYRRCHCPVETVSPPQPFSYLVPTTSSRSKDLPQRPWTGDSPPVPFTRFVYASRPPFQSSRVRSAPRTPAKRLCSLRPFVHRNRYEPHPISVFPRRPGRIAGALRDRAVSFTRDSDERLKDVTPSTVTGVSYRMLRCTTSCVAPTIRGIYLANPPTPRPLHRRWSRAATSRPFRLQSFDTEIDPSPSRSRAISLPAMSRLHSPRGHDHDLHHGPTVCFTGITASESTSTRRAVRHIDQNTFIASPSQNPAVHTPRRPTSPSRAVRSIIRSRPGRDDRHAEHEPPRRGAMTDRSSCGWGRPNNASLSLTPAR